MPEEKEPPDSSLPEQSTLLGNIAPDEMLARGMQSVKMTSGATGTWQPPTMEECARLFPGYEVLRLLGRGGMGAVYQARQIELDRLVAIKLLPLEISVDKDFADRFRREARAMAKLNHPNIIAVYDFGTTREGHLFFVMEFVEGANLYDIIHQVGLDGDQALSIAEQVCTALAYAHSKGIVHRDIKPANVMIDTESHVKVADFGLARLTDSSAMDLGHTMTGTVMGTPDYMAPEQMKGMNVDHRADIYSVGVMLYEMLCREVPKGIFDPPSHRTSCDVRIDQIVIRSMQQAPDRRYQSTAEMKSDILSARVPVIVPDVQPALRVSASPAPLGPPKKPAPPKAAGAAAPNRPALPIAAKPAVMKAIPLPGPKKSKLPLYAGLGVGVVAIAAAAFFLLKPKEEKLTQAQIYAREHAAGNIGHGPAKPVAFEPGAIKLWDKPEKIPKEAGLSWENEALRLEGHSVNAFAPLSRNAAIRATIRLTADARIPQICVRYGGAKGNEHGYVLGLTPENGVGGTIQLQAITDGKYRMLKEWALPRALGPDEWAPVELRALGDEVSVFIDGQPLGTVHDASQTEPGGIHVFAKANGYFRDIVYVPLDKVADQKTAASIPQRTSMPGGPMAGAEPGFRPLFDGQTLAGWSAYGGAAPSAAWRAQDGTVMVTGDRSWLVTKETFGDFELRLDWKVGPNGNGGIFFRMPGGEGSRPLTAPEFQLCARDVSDAFKTGTLYNVLRLSDDASLPTGEWNTARLVVRGSRCEHWVNEKLVLSYDLKSEEWKKQWQASSFAKDPRFAQATEGWIALQGWTGDVAYRNIRIRPLSTAP
ncbi:MAG: DUF1080 domain-containing protein [Chthoniobacter sp.]|nr:DUF1080 domain-containing protein [Chthoniobacter sp.]